MPSPTGPTPSNQGLHGATAVPGHSELKRETIKIPIPKPDIGGNLPPIPPKVARAAAVPDPEDNRRREGKGGASAPAAPICVATSPRLGIVPGGVKPALETKQAESAPKPSPQLDGWLKIAATGAGALAVTSLCYAAELVWNVAHGSMAGNIAAGVGVVAVVGLGARLLGVFPSGSRQVS